MYMVVLTSQVRQTPKHDEHGRVAWPFINPVENVAPSQGMRPGLVIRDPDGGVPIGIVTRRENDRSNLARYVIALAAGETKGAGLARGWQAKEKEKKEKDGRRKSEGLRSLFRGVFHKEKHAA